jgi:hypothetical protein
MTTNKGHPSRDELLVMAYVDDELAPEIRDEMNERLAREPELRRMVAEYQKLEVIARQCAPPEPADHEWDRLEGEVLRRGAFGLGFTLLFVGAVGLIGWATYGVAISEEMSPIAKLLCGALLAGFMLLLLLKLRDRLRIIPFDPYTEVKR